MRKLIWLAPIAAVLFWVMAAAPPLPPPRVQLMVTNLTGKIGTPTNFLNPNVNFVAGTNVYLDKTNRALRINVTGSTGGAAALTNTGNGIGIVGETGAVTPIKSFRTDNIIGDDTFFTWATNGTNITLTYYLNDGAILLLSFIDSQIAGDPPDGSVLRYNAADMEIQWGELGGDTVLSNLWLTGSNNLFVSINDLSTQLAVAEATLESDVAWLAHTNTFVKPQIIAAGTVTTNTYPALSISQTWNNGALHFTGVVIRATQIGSPTTNESVYLNVADLFQVHADTSVSSWGIVASSNGFYGPILYDNVQDGFYANGLGYWTKRSGYYAYSDTASAFGNPSTMTYSPSIGTIQVQTHLIVDGNLTFGPATTYYGVRLKSLTSAQWNAIADNAGVLGWDTDALRVVVSDGTDWKYLSYTNDPGGGGGGEANTMSSSGTGVGINNPKSSVNLPIKSFTDSSVLLAWTTNGSEINLAFDWAASTGDLATVSFLATNINNLSSNLQAQLDAKASSSGLASSTNIIAGYVREQASNDVRVTAGTGISVTPTASGGVVSYAVAATGGAGADPLTINSNIFYTMYDLTASSQTTNYIWDFNIAIKTNLASSSIHLQQSTNRSSSLGKPSTLVIRTGNTNRHFSYNSSWTYTGGSVPTTLLGSNLVWFVNAIPISDTESGVYFSMFTSGTNSFSDNDIINYINQTTNNVMTSAAAIYAPLAAANTFSGTVNTFNQIRSVQNGFPGDFNTNIFLQNIGAGNIRTRIVFDNGTRQADVSLFSTNFGGGAEVYRNAFVTANELGAIFFFAHSSIATPNYQLGVLSNRVVLQGLALGNALDGIAPVGVMTNLVYTNLTLDFPATTLGSVADLPVAIAGVKAGDMVSVNPPTGSWTAIAGSYSGVSSNGAVFVRFLSTGTAQDPASGTFNVEVRGFR